MRSAKLTRNGETASSTSSSRACLVTGTAVAPKGISSANSVNVSNTFTASRSICVPASE